MSQVTSHVLDTTKGKPAAGITIVLYQQQQNNWQEIAKGTTNNDGRVADLLGKEVQLPLGIYKIKFLTKAYFDQLSIHTFYPFIEIVFNISASEHYHIPLLLNPFGYTTYRGS